jgi:hypothetical protein
METSCSDPALEREPGLPFDRGLLPTSDSATISIESMGDGCEAKLNDLFPKWKMLEKR